MKTLVATVVAAVAITSAQGPGRPANDLLRDDVRKPAEMMIFSRVEKGSRVGEYTPGSGYFTRILAAAVGQRGHVYIYPPTEIVRLVPRHLIDAQALASTLSNVTVRTGPNSDFGAPEPLDVVFTAQNYHDLHSRFAPPGAAANFNAAVFRALRRGGRYVIIDHSARPGSGVLDTDRLHRIDPARVRAEVEAAGFRFEAESRALANPGDARTASIFDPSIRGATDQFALRFRKP